MNENGKDIGESLQEYWAHLPEEPEKKEFRGADALCAVFGIIFGYLFMRWVFFRPYAIGLGAALLTAAVGIFSVLRMRIQGIRLRRIHLFGLFGVLFVSFSFFLTDSMPVKILSGVCVLFALSYWVYWASGNREEERLGGMFPFDGVKSLFIMPFSCFGDLFRALSACLKRTAGGRKILIAVAGVAVAAAPTAVVVILLMQADGAFSNLLDTLFSDILGGIPEHILYLCFGLPVGMYFFGMLYANVTHRNRSVMTAGENTLILSAVRRVPVIGMCAAILPLLFVYVLFFVSQSAYFLSAFSGIRPEGITYAEYARRGFFELCGVCLINSGAALIACVFTKRTEEKLSAAIRLCTGALAVSSLCLIAVALSKMFMYIGAYGLTRLRIYTTWFMAVLAVLFVLFLIWLVRPAFSVMRAGALSCAVLLAVLAFGDADRITAAYNVHRYTSGQAADVDIQMMYELSDAAVEYVLPLTQDANASVAMRAARYIEWKRAELAEPQPFSAFNLTTARARRILFGGGS